MEKYYNADYERTTVFNLASHDGVQKIDQRGTIVTKLSQICAYADGILIIARTQKKLTEVYLDLEEETSKLGMEINENKTKYTVTSTYIVVPWLQEGCQSWLAGSVSIEQFVATNSSVDTLPANQL